MLYIFSKMGNLNILEKKMRAKTFYVGIGLVNFLLPPAYGMLFEERSDPFHTFSRLTVREEPTLGNGIKAAHKTEQNAEEQNNPNCRLIGNKVSEVEKILQNYKEQVEQIPESEIQRYEAYLGDLKDLYTKASQIKKMNARQELFVITNKYF